MQPSRKPDTILSLDVGAKRIGVARAYLEAPFPGPLTTLENPDSFQDDIVRLATAENAAAVIIGLPRGMQGQETDQTAVVREFGAHLGEKLSVPVYWTDEAVTSEKAEAELKRRRKPYVKGDIDALAATYILEDFLRDNPRLAAELATGGIPQTTEGEGA